MKKRMEDERRAMTTSMTRALDRNRDIRESFVRGQAKELSEKLDDHRRIIRAGRTPVSFERIQILENHGKETEASDVFDFDGEVEVEPAGVRGAAATTVATV